MDYRLDYSYLNVDVSVWKAVEKKIRRKWRHTVFPQNGVIVIPYPGDMIDEYQVKVLVSSIISDILDRKLPITFLDTGSSERRKLELDAKPEVNTYLFYSTRLCILQTREEYREWLMRQFIGIQIFYHSSYKNVFFLQEETESMLSYERLDFWMMSNVKDIINYTKEYLNKETYINIHLDGFYISATDYYKRKHFVHEMLIYAESGVESRR